MKTRCEWVRDNPMEIEYHDKEWCTPEHDDRRLFELLVLEGAQAGLSWKTILTKRENFRQAFDGFDPSRIAEYGADKIAELLNNPGIVRNRLKIEATISNALAYLKIQEEFGTFDRYIWQFVSGRPIQNSWVKLRELPSRTMESDEMSKDLKKRGFAFVGSIICYSFMQAVGMVNDHTVNCFRYKELIDTQK
mgnify:CR=1 FL=1